MAECNRKPLLFSSLSSQKVTAYFDGGRLSSDAGGLLLREADRRLGEQRCGKTQAKRRRTDAFQS